MAGLKTLYSKDGVPLTDIRASVVRSWMMHGVGDATFFLYIYGSKCKQDYLGAGNYIVVQHDKLPPWVGVIAPPQPWHNGYVEVHAYEPAYMLQYRFAPLGSVLSGTPGDRFLQLLNFANSQGETLIDPGLVSGNGTTVAEEKLNSSSESIYSLIEKLRQNNGQEWITYPSIGPGGKLSILMDWRDKLGVETPLELSQGHNLMYGDTPLEETGEQINYVEAVSAQTEEGILSAVYHDPQPYGIRAVRLTFSGVTDQATLASYAKAYVDEKKRIKYSTPLTAMDVGSTFYDIRLGNIVSHRSKVGFYQGQLGIRHFVRIKGFRYDDGNKTCELYTNEVA